MSHKPFIAVYRFAITVACSMMIGVAAFAQEAEQVTADDDDESQEIVVIEELADIGDSGDPGDTEEVEEIIVVAPKPGSRRRIDDEYDDPVRARILKEYYRMQELEEEYEWRKPDPSESSSRIKWGYDPRDDYRMRREMDLQDLSWEKEKPATVFRVEF